MAEPMHLNMSPILLLPVFSLLHGAEAQSAIQPATPFGSPTVWDVSSVGVMIGALIATLLLVFVLLMFLRRCYARSHGGDSESRCEGGTGIHPQLLETFPVLFYSSLTKHLEEGPLQCAVCLADFNHRDTLRLLPQCNHVFHPPCIDAWLSSHVTCPVCRANLILNHHQHHSLHLAISVVDAESNAAQGSPVSGGDEEDRGEREQRASQSKLSRSNSTGHSLVEDGACVERYTLRLPEDVKKQIMEKEEVVQRSASYNIVGSSMRGLCWSDSEGSSRGKRYGIGLSRPATATGRNLR